MDEQAAYRRASRRVGQLKAIYVHAAIFLIVNLGLFLVDVVADRGHWWFFWPLIVWGIGLAAHAFFVFGLGGTIGQEWEERKIQEVMAHDRPSEGAVS